MSAKGGDAVDEGSSLRLRRAASTATEKQGAQVDRGAPLWHGATNDVIADADAQAQAEAGATGSSGESEFPRFAGDLPWSERSWWYELRPFRGMYYDIRRRLPFVKTDWTSALDPRNWWTIVQYIPRMYFIK